MSPFCFFGKEGHGEGHSSTLKGPLSFFTTHFAPLFLPLFPKKVFLFPQRSLFDVALMASAMGHNRCFVGFLFTTAFLEQLKIYTLSEDSGDWFLFLWLCFRSEKEKKSYWTIWLSPFVIIIAPHNTYFLCFKNSVTEIILQFLKVFVVVVDLLDQFINIQSPQFFLNLFCWPIYSYPISNFIFKFFGLLTNLINLYVSNFKSF